MGIGRHREAEVTGGVASIPGSKNNKHKAWKWKTKKHGGNLK